MGYDEQEYSQKFSIRTWKRLLPFVSPYKKAFALMLFFNCLTALMDVLLPLFQRYAVDEFIEAGTLNVFDCSKFTVDGEHLTTYKADVDTDDAFTPDTEAITTKDGVTYFAESEFRSAPYFDVKIDGINWVNKS